MDTEEDITRTQLLFGRWQTAGSEGLVRDYVHRWCRYYVMTENFDRGGVHGLDPSHPSPRTEDAIPAPWRMAECSRYALALHRELLHASSSKEAAARAEAKQIASGMCWRKVVHEARIELLPLHRGPMATHPDFAASFGGDQ